MTIQITRQAPFVRRRRPRGHRISVAGAFAAGAASGGAALFFLDPRSGRRRRKLSADRVAGAVRRGLRRFARAGRQVRATSYGAAQSIRHRSEGPRDLDDVTLARKVETELFRDPEVPKGQISINAQRGLVQLRGEVPNADMVTALVEQARTVSGVRDVESLLHLPGVEAPMHQ